MHTCPTTHTDVHFFSFQRLAKRFADTSNIKNGVNFSHNLFVGHYLISRDKSGKRVFFFALFHISYNLLYYPVFLSTVLFFFEISIKIIKTVFF